MAPPPHRRPWPMPLLPGEPCARAERASGAGARSHPATGHGMWALDPGPSSCKLQPPAGKRGPANGGIPRVCAVPQGRGLYSPHGQCPAHSPCAPPPAHSHSLLCTRTHCVYALLAHTHLRTCSPWATTPPMHTHTAPICALPLHTQLPVHTHASPYTLPVHTPCTLTPPLYPLSFCTHILCTLTHPLYTLPVHTYTPVVHAHTSPMHSPHAHAHILRTLMQLLYTLSLHTPPMPCARSCIPYTLSPRCTLVHPLYMLSPVHTDPHAHLSSLPHPHTAASPQGHLSGTRSHLSGAISPAPCRSPAQPATCTGDLPPL